MFLTDKDLPVAVSCLSVLEYSPKILVNDIPYRPWPSFLAVGKGKYEYREGERTITLREGDVLFLPKGAVYTYHILSSETLTFQLTFNLYPDVLNESLPRELTLMEPKSAAQIRQVFPDLQKAFRSQEKLASFTLASLIFRCLEVLTAQIDTAPYSKQIMPAVRWLAQNYNAPVAVDDLARLCLLSPSQFRRIFVKETGCSPIRYKNILRKEEACRLLRQSELNVSEIAAVLRFETVYAFSKFFKNETGISPNQYRKQK